MTATILRRWASRIRSEDRAAYTGYVERTGVSDCGATEGNLGFKMLLRDLGDGTTEVATLSWWTSIEAIKALAGENHERARNYREATGTCCKSPIASSIPVS